MQVLKRYSIEMLVYEAYSYVATPSFPLRLTLLYSLSFCFLKSFLIIGNYARNAWRVITCVKISCFKMTWGHHGDSKTICVRVGCLNTHTVFCGQTQPQPRGHCLVKACILYPSEWKVDYLCFLKVDYLFQFLGTLVVYLSTIVVIIFFIIRSSSCKRSEICLLLLLDYSKHNAQTPVLVSLKPKLLPV